MVIVAGAAHCDRYDRYIQISVSVSRRRDADMSGTIKRRNAPPPPTVAPPMNHNPPQGHDDVNANVAKPVPSCTAAETNGHNDVTMRKSTSMPISMDNNGSAVQATSDDVSVTSHDSGSDGADVTFTLVLPDGTSSSMTVGKK